jgi:NAD(P)-dependent dehydrogenase (short-subunit alcohol dehydrogenase family)
MLADESKKTGLSLAELEKDFFTNARPTSLIQRLSEPEEIANMVVYACSDGASSTTGASLRVEGGIVTGLG